MSEFHAVGGRYDINEKWIGIDYANSFMQYPEHVEAVVTHEAVHAIIAGTDYGQASHIVFRSRAHFQHVNNQEALRMEQLIFFSQDFVQEGLATYMQIARLARIKGKRYALEWADQHLPTSYKVKFEKLKFLFGMSQRYKDMFTSKAYRIAMDNNFQQDAPRLELLKDTTTLEQYLLTKDHSPNLRLEALVDAVSLNNWLATKSIPEIAEKAGLPLYDVASKEEGAAFSTYVANLTDKPYTFKAEDVGDPIPYEQLREEAMDSLIVTNLNLNLSENSELLLNKDDFLFYADVLDSVFVNYHDETWSERELIKSAIGEYPDLALVGFTKSGEKYAFYCSKETAISLFTNELKDVTLVVKWGGYSLEHHAFIWSSEARQPNVVWYNSPNHIKDTLGQYVKDHPDVSLQRLHIGATQDHPLQTLFVIEDGSNVLHVVNDFGNVRISKAVDAISKNSTIMEATELRKIKQHINNFLVLQGMLRKIDWVETMIVQNELKYRTD